MARRKPLDPHEPVDVWTITLRRDRTATRGVPTSVLIRRLLKAALRVYGLRCVSVGGRRTFPALSPLAARHLALSINALPPEAA